MRTKRTKKKGYSRRETFHKFKIEHPIDDTENTEELDRIFVDSWAVENI